MNENCIFEGTHFQMVDMEANNGFISTSIKLCRIFATVLWYTSALVKMGGVNGGKLHLQTCWCTAARNETLKAGIFEERSERYVDVIGT